jgi:RHS repeat-associated protein
METGLQFSGKTQKVIFRKVGYTTGTANSAGSGPVFVRISGDTGFAGETGLYYYGARYLDPKVSRWLSADPALGEYIPSAPVNDEARRRNGNLPGQGGIFNLVNLHVYHYAGNNPMKYVDPDGRESENVFNHRLEAKRFIEYYLLLSSRLTYTDVGWDIEGPCYVRSLMGLAESVTGKNLTAEQLNGLKNGFMEDGLVNPAPHWDVTGNGGGSPEILKRTLSVLDPEGSYSIVETRLGWGNYESVKSEATNSLRHVGRADGSSPGIGAHWQEGDAKGRFIWDSKSGINSRGREFIEKDTRYFTIKREE